MLQRFCFAAFGVYVAERVLFGDDRGRLVVFVRARSVALDGRGQAGMGLGGNGEAELGGGVEAAPCDSSLAEGFESCACGEEHGA